MFRIPLSFKRKEFILKNFLIHASSGKTPQEILELLMMEYSNNENILETIKNIRDGYNALNPLSKLLLDFKFIKEKEFFLIQSHDNEIEAIKQIIQMRQGYLDSNLEIFKIMGTKILVLFTALLMGYLYINDVKKFIIKFVSQVPDANIKNLNFPIYFNEDFFLISLIFLSTVLLVVIITYYYTRFNHISIHYRIFDYKAYEDMIYLLNILKLLLYSNKSEMEISRIIEKNIKPYGLKIIFEEISNPRKRNKKERTIIKARNTIGKQLKKYHVTGDISSLYEVYERNNDLKEKKISYERDNTEVKITPIEDLIRIAKEKAQNRLKYIKNDFLLFGLDFSTKLVLVLLVVFAVFSSLEFVKQLAKITANTI